LDTLEFALVTAPPTNGGEKAGRWDRRRPWAVLLNAERGKGAAGKAIVNLAEKDSRTGTYLRNIVKSYNPHDFGIQPSEIII